VLIPRQIDRLAVGRKIILRLKYLLEYQILKKIENQTNALAANLLDNSETAHRLKRFTVLTLPDRSELNPIQELK
jgi:hypothetical protein